ncbi:MAG: hypothetical protein COA88_14615 [Kordia sp.]|jgi:hypothetical protein|nr:MAG: hypothetical protein COA88_14615 [Kordia sp.]
MNENIFTISMLAIGTPDPVNLSRTFTFLKHKSPDQKQSDVGKYQILFVRDENSVSPRETAWKYNNEENRDCEYEALVSKYGVKLEK